MTNLTLGTIFTAIIAGVVTLFDLDRKFYIPRAAQQRVRLYVWWWGFIITNGLFAGALYTAVADLPGIKSLPVWLRAIAVGAGYLSALRQKFTTVKQESIGVEFLYERAKAFVFKRINFIARDARFTETRALADQYPLPELENRVRAAINHDALLTDDEKKQAHAWVASVMADNSAETNKREALADFLLSGQQNTLH